MSEQTQSGSELHTRNLELLKHEGELGSVLANVYSLAIDEHPELNQMVIHPRSAQDSPKFEYTAGWAVPSTRTDSGLHEITALAKDGIEPYRSLIQRRRYASERVSRMLGVEDIEHAPELFAAFIFAHEIGHVSDYIKRPMSDEGRRAEREQQFSDVGLPVGFDRNAFIEHFSGEGRIERLRGSDEIFSGRSDQEVEDIAEQMLKTAEHRYRSIPQEMIADQFATKIIKKYIDNK